MPRLHATMKIVEDIEKTQGSRFSYWKGQGFVFSSSDNSDPNSTDENIGPFCPGCGNDLDVADAARAASSSRHHPRRQRSERGDMVDTDSCVPPKEPIRPLRLIAHMSKPGDRHENRNDHFGWYCGPHHHQFGGFGPTSAYGNGYQS